MTEVTARRIAEALAEVRCESVRYPTLEQQAVIEADPAEPALVVAGAGSGKTETMANRVLWLVANRHLAYEATLEAGFAEVRHAGVRDGFKVIEARRPRR